MKRYHVYTTHFENKHDPEQAGYEMNVTDRSMSEVILEVLRDPEHHISVVFSMEIGRPAYLKLKKRIEEKAEEDGV